MSDSGDSVTVLRKALAHLHDPLYLGALPLANDLGLPAGTSVLSRGLELRRALWLAIDTLTRGSDTIAIEIDLRARHILSRYAISKRSMTTIASELHISERHAYRDLRRAIGALAQVMRALREGSSERLLPSHDKETSPVNTQGELERILQVTDQNVDITRLLEDSVASVTPLAAEKKVAIQVAAEPRSLYATLNRVMVRQAIINFLSHAVECAEQGESIVARLSRSGADALVELCHHPQVRASSRDSTSPFAVGAHLCDLLGIKWSQTHRDAGAAEISLWIRLTSERTVLVIDDNEDLIALFRRYVQRQPYQVHGARDSEQAFEMVDRLKPDVVILDIMMPHRDGWEILQALRERESNYRPHIIVCSIINDPQLAGALGADAFLHKPVTRDQLIQALEKVLSSSI